MVIFNVHRSIIENITAAKKIQVIVLEIKKKVIIKDSENILKNIVH